MTSKAQRLRRRKQSAVERFYDLAGRQKPAPEPTEETQRPTAERMSRGVWTIAAPRAPAVDLAADYIGKLYAAKLIEYHHHESARAFQQIVAAFMADLPVAGFRSCLAEGFGGYDAGDGNPEAAKAYASMKRKLGAVRFAYLRTETEKPADAPIRDVDTLRNALEAVLK
jgi:hypothetical protein